MKFLNKIKSYLESDDAKEKIKKAKEVSNKLKDESVSALKKAKKNTEEYVEEYKKKKNAIPEQNKDEEESNSETNKKTVTNKETVKTATPEKTETKDVKIEAKKSKKEVKPKTKAKKSVSDVVEENDDLTFEELGVTSKALKALNKEGYFKKSDIDFVANETLLEIEGVGATTIKKLRG